MTPPPRRSTDDDPSAGPSSSGRAGREPSSTGQSGEALAASHLRTAGFRIVARNLRTIDAEIDLLVRRRRLWIAVEVKTRRSHPAPERAVTPRQLERLQRALARLAPSLRPRPRLLRVDVVAVRVSANADPEISHFEGSPFEPPTRR